MPVIINWDFHQVKLYRTEQHLLIRYGHHLHRLRLLYVALRENLWDLRPSQSFVLRQAARTRHQSLREEIQCARKDVTSVRQKLDDLPPRVTHKV